MVDRLVDAIAQSTPTQQGWPWGDAPSSLLLIEDDAGDALLVREMLAETGMTAELVWVRSLREASDHLAAGQDCVLLDLHLPDVQGLEGVRRVLATAADTPIVVVTGVHDEQAGLAAVAAGAQDYLTKGRLDGALLARAVRYATERKQAERTSQQLRDTELVAAENARLERGLLPRPIVGSAVTVDSRYRPGRQRALLGGDFYDIVETDDGTLRVVIGDVSGHGPDEAAIGASLRISWRALVLSGVDDSVLVQLLEQILLTERLKDETFATLCLMTVDDDRRGADVLCAGHPPPLLLHEEETAPLPLTPQLPIALVDGLDRGRPDRVEFPGRGGVLLYTDGLVEGHVDKGSERLGVSGLVDVVARLRRDPDDTPLVDRIVDSVAELDGGRLDDDLAVVHLQWSRR